MTVFKFRCPACEHEDRVERPKPPRHCPECGSPVRDVREIPPERPKPAPPEEPQERGEAAPAPSGGRACRRGCVPPTQLKCERCPEEDCGERAAKYKRHWKRRKVVRIIKALLGKDIADVVSDREVWKDIARSRARKVLDALGVEGEERDEMLRDIEDSIDKGHERLKRKLK